MTTGNTPGDIPPSTPTTPTGTSGTAGYASAGTTGSTTGSTTGGTTGGTTGSSTQTRDVAKDEARGVAQDAAQSTRQTAETAKEQAGQVADEAMSQARQLLDQTRQQVVSTGVAQQERAASSLRSLADELTGMVNGEGSQSGLAADFARQASDQIRTAAQFLEDREPADLLQEVRRFAQRRPGMFLLSAAAVGFVGGRVTRGVTAGSDSGHSSGSLGTSLRSGQGGNSLSLTTAPGAPSMSGTPAGDTVPTGPAGTGGGFSARSGDEAPLSGYAVPPERTDTEPPHGDPTSTFIPGSQTGGPAQDRI